MENKDRAKVICHMMTTIDGKIVIDWDGNEDYTWAGDKYDSMIDEYSRVMVNGRETIADFCTGKTKPEDYKGIPVTYEDKIIQPVGGGSIWAVIDRYGKLFFDEPNLNYAGHDWLPLKVLTKKAAPEQIAYLDAVGLPYIFAGEDDFEPRIFLEKIKQYYGVDQVMLGGGAYINAVFMEEDLIDEISIIIGPAVDGTRDALTLVGTETRRSFPRYFQLKEVKDLGHNTVFLHYVR